MKTILIILIWTKAVGPGIEFDDMEACQAAQAQIQKWYRSENFYLGTFCVPKASKP